MSDHSGIIMLLAMYDSDSVYSKTKKKKNLTDQNYVIFIYILPDFSPRMFGG
jgi:hypothetical protein